MRRFTTVMGALSRKMRRFTTVIGALSRKMRRPTIAFTVFATVMGALSIFRYATFHSRSLDMAYYVRLVWGIAHGAYDQPIVGAPHFLGLHLEPILFPFAAFAKLGIPIAEMLLVAQALAAGAVIFPASALAERHLAGLIGSRLAFGAALSVYLYPSLTRCVDYDFHPSTMVVWPLFALINAIDERKLGSQAVWIAVALSFREDVGLQVAFLAAALALGPRPRQERLFLLATVLIGIAWFFGYTLLVQPNWLPPANRGSFGAHFAQFGAGQVGVSGILKAAFSDPIGLGRYLLSDGRLWYPLALMAPLAMLPLLAPTWLAGAIPLVIINMLSAYPGVRTIQAHYITAAVPFLVAAAITGCARASRFFEHRAIRKLPAVAFVLIAATGWALRGASPFSPEWRWGAYAADARVENVRIQVSGIDPNARVTAPSPIAAHLAERREIRIGKELSIE